MIRILVLDYNAIGYLQAKNVLEKLCVGAEVLFVDNQPGFKKILEGEKFDLVLIEFMIIGAPTSLELSVVRGLIDAARTNNNKVKIIVVTSSDNQSFIDLLDSLNVQTTYKEYSYKQLDKLLE
jgi:CheY-like chemotaxis protein